MSSLNKVMIIGRLGQDPEKKTTANGSSFVTISVATSESWKDQSGNKQEKTEWHKVIFWNKQAELVAQYLKKGSLVYIEGSIENQQYEKDGEKRYSTQIKGRNVTFLDSKGSGSTQGTPGPNSDSAFMEDDIPF